ncbi:hypothetical protein [Terasakiella sp. SH-1]|uniref:hypothetical protein n=1 Tax=Terasakiella sp. SH-1 TaxID=2560057 RepID=UPI001073AB2F|nr:hypothetical protein [Terasakiella sp. SH-1]
MANELRKIVFNGEEISAALGVLGEKAQLDIPKAPLKGVTEEPGGYLILIFDNVLAQPLKLRTKDMIAALLIFCQQKKIMVPKNGKKVLKAEGKSLTMLIKMA